MSITDTVKTPDMEMRYIRFGEGKRTLVILPGLSVQSVVPAAPAIEKQYEVFLKDYTVYLFDRRESLPSVYSVYDMAKDTARAMIELGLSDVCLFGASQGGMMAMSIAAIHPELVSRLALGSTACHVKESRSVAIDEWIRLAQEGNAEALYLAFGEKLYPPALFQTYRATLQQVSKTVTPTDLKRFIILAQGLHGFDMTDMMKDIRCPVLAMGDTHDAVLGATALSEIAEQMKDNPNFEAYMYHGYGHAAYDTAPDYTQRLYRFFNGEGVTADK